jgi:hypothetical protein
MNGKVIGVILVTLGLTAGIAMYWLQEYAFYEEARLEADGGDVAMTITATSGEVADLPVADFTAIDADSSPIRFRACFTAEVPAGLTPMPYEAAEPLNAPRWFDCFDAAAIGADLKTGAAMAVLGQPNVLYGIDRVIALYPDGRAFAWHQINECGEEVFDGQPAPEGCPPPPQGTE